MAKSIRNVSKREITLIFPDQLFAKHPAVIPSRPVYLVEEFHFFRSRPFHKQKLILLRGAMKAYAEFLIREGLEVVYLESKLMKRRGDLFEHLAQLGVGEIHISDFPDHELKRDVEKASDHFQIERYPSPMFLCSEDEVTRFFEGKKHFSMASFYASERKKRNILMEEGSPVGGKFSFDQENRKRLPKDCQIPDLYKPKSNGFVTEAIAYVEREFPSAVGEAEPFLYPVTFKDAKNALADFIKHRLALFGDYEDAIREREPFLFHSVLSPLLNIGLLTPQEVIDAALFATGIPLNSLEGFLRQIMGWREFMRACYHLKGEVMRSSNHFHHNADLPKGFWDGTTGIEPIDSTIKRILKTGYCHHIERLMVIGNFLLLTETDPDLVYSWFMSFFVDAYDWVMVPNVYSMSQFSDQGLITTKPYLSGSNYLLKMSDYAKGDWCDVWDGLFWRFLKKHKSLFQRNPRTKVLVQLLAKNALVIEAKIAIAERWLKTKGDL